MKFTIIPMRKAESHKNLYPNLLTSTAHAPRWFEGKQILWLWVFTRVTATLFVVGQRTRELAISIFHKITGLNVRAVSWHWMIARNISHGTHTAEGSSAFANLASVIETCRKRTTLPWVYIAEVVKQRRRRLAVPLLPIKAGN